MVTGEWIVVLKLFVELFEEQENFHICIYDLLKWKYHIPQLHVCKFPAGKSQDSPRRKCLNLPFAMIMSDELET